MTDPMQQARELSSPDEIAFRLRNLAQNMAAGSGPVARDHQAWKRVEELAEAVAALRAAPEGFVMVPVEPTQEMLDMVCTADGFEPWTDKTMGDVYRTMLAARPQGVNNG